jgi:hypothetical protein
MVTGVLRIMKVIHFVGRKIVNVVERRFVDRGQRLGGTDHSLPPNSSFIYALDESHYLTSSMKNIYFTVNDCASVTKQCSSGILNRPVRPTTPASKTGTKGPSSKTLIFTVTLCTTCFSSPTPVGSIALFVVHAKPYFNIPCSLEYGKWRRRLSTVEQTI